MEDARKLTLEELIPIGLKEDPRDQNRNYQSHIPQFTPSHNTFCTHYLIIPEWFSGDSLDV